MSPDIHQVAKALARKFGWRIQPSGAAAMNLIGLSTQVPSQYLYQSDGPDRSYKIGNTSIRFKHSALKETGFRIDESGLIFQALKALGENQISDETIDLVRRWLPESKRQKVLKDTERVTTATLTKSTSPSNSLTNALMSSSRLPKQWTPEGS